jgi:hypothetical protein
MDLTRLSVRSQFRPGDETVGSAVVGLGDPNPEGSRQAVILYHKGYATTRLASVSQFVASALAQVLVERQELTAGEVRALLSGTMNRPALAKRPTRLHPDAR